MPEISQQELDRVRALEPQLPQKKRHRVRWPFTVLAAAGCVFIVVFLAAGYIDHLKHPLPADDTQQIKDFLAQEDRAVAQRLSEIRAHQPVYDWVATDSSAYTLSRGAFWSSGELPAGVELRVAVKSTSPVHAAFVSKDLADALGKGANELPVGKYYCAQTNILAYTFDCVMPEASRLVMRDARDTQAISDISAALKAYLGSSGSLSALDVRNDVTITPLFKQCVKNCP
ncbi:MAG TPA: hypothetical protein VH024_00240 [Candidatus Angelobacter sp.]|jgi:hypothetical protein|nr:hypothetical protein [Candidatus Angelobacter sp.]